MVRILPLFLALLFSFSSFAQQEDEQNIKNQKKRAILQIKRLKEGALLVRLFDKTKQIELLEKQGKPSSIVQAYKDKVAKENIEIIEAFKENFEFCPVYFFYSKDSKHVRNRNFKEVNFVDKSVNTTEADLSKAYFYTADLSELRVDTFSYITTVSGRDENDNEVIKRGKKTYVSYEAITIRSDKFIDLQAPYPYSVRTYRDLPLFKRTKAKTVQKLNKKLEYFYDKFQHLEFDPLTNNLVLKEIKE